MLEVALGTAGNLGKRRFSRQAETEADLERLRMLTAAGIARVGMVASLNIGYGLVKNDV